MGAKFEDDSQQQKRSSTAKPLFDSKNAIRQQKRYSTTKTLFNTQLVPFFSGGTHDDTWNRQGIRVPRFANRRERASEKAPAP
jgi:hypothetical protein